MLADLVPPVIHLPVERRPRWRPASKVVPQSGSGKCSYSYSYCADYSRETLRDNDYTMALRPWSHNMNYYDFVLRCVVPGCQRVLDVGCGQGLLARRLAQCCKEVIAIDVDHDVIFRARASSSSDSSIRFVKVDVMTYPFPDESFDLVTLVATIHHLQLRPALIRLRKLLKPGGVLAIVGLYRGETLTALTVAAAAFPVSWIFLLVRGYADVGAPVQEPRETLAEIRRECDLLLPGATLRRRLLFRYSLIWRKAPK